MKKISMAALILMLLLTGCAPNFQKQEEVVQEKQDTNEKAIIPKYKISDEYYSSILPFKPSEARGLVVGNLNTRYDINEFETGLMRIAQRNFDPNQYFFQEGQYLKKNIVQLWLNRKFTDEQLKANGLDQKQNIGLNPLKEGNEQADFQKNPIYLAHILEHDYLEKGSDGTVHLGGVVIGLALNSVYYYQTEQYGATYEADVKGKVEQEGKNIAAEVLKRLREMDDLKNVPITIALFEQKEKSSVVPGNFIAYANASKGSSSLGNWETIDEQYVLFPNGGNKEDSDRFNKFKQDVEKYFPNFNGVIGKAFYADKNMQQLDIEIPIQFYGKAEAISFTQFVTGKVMEIFPKYITVQVSISSVNGPESLIVRKAEQDEPFVHIYQ
ncbi:CamS family sex pheromone protein [Bacillus sp. 03113]|uniref:CamS family sex pheromone protein n=1 Tax=Bacillus sp. 03113 TaxID=2578211 RepID=UPI0011414EC2|nr:CamS family sex pheromone protein [Bacillus sp. 03113]